MSDSELLDLMRSGDESAFVEVYNRYWKKLLAISYNHTKDKLLAQEIVQQVFISLWDRRKIITIESVEAYLATAAKFTIFKYRATESRHKEILSRVNITSVTRSDQQIDAKFLEEYIAGVVETLPEKCKLVFKYSRFEHLNISEIAEEMNISKKTVESHLSKALKTLRLSLREAGLLSFILLTKYLD